VDKGYDAEDFVNELKSMNVTLRLTASQGIGYRWPHDPIGGYAIQPAHPQ
jgi:hypothetical protein